MAHHALALDIGGSHVSAAVVDLERHSVLEGSEARAAVDPDAPADVLLGAWAMAGLEAHERAERPAIARVGVAMPGPFEYALGVSKLEHKFAALYGRDVGEGLGRDLEETLGPVPIAFGNDATMFALGEWWAGGARGFERVLGVTLGTGLGGGFVVHGQPRYDGDDLPPQGAIWNLPYLGGIAEDAVSGRALEREYAARTGRQIMPVQIAEAARGGDTDARAVFEAMGLHLGRVLAPWVRRFRPGCVVLGGNLSRASRLFTGALEAELRAEPVVVRSSTLFERANLLGAAALEPPEARP